MRQRFPKIQPLHPPAIVPPAGSVAAGVTPDGKQIYRLVRARSRPIPAFDPRERQRLMDEIRKRERGGEIKNDEDLMRVATEEELNPQQVYRRNQLTGEPMYPVNKPLVYQETLLFTLESHGNGNVGMEPYVPPSPEQIAAEERAEKVAQMRDALAAELVDRGLTPEEFVASLTGERNAPKADPVPPPEDDAAPAAEYPKNLGGGWWKLSNGERMQVKKDEVDKVYQAEAAIAETREAVAETPEV